MYAIFTIIIGRLLTRMFAIFKIIIGRDSVLSIIYVTHITMYMYTLCKTVRRYKTLRTNMAIEVPDSVL